MADAGKKSVIKIGLVDTAGDAIQLNASDFNAVCLKSSGLSLSTDLLDTTNLCTSAVDSFRRKIEGLKDG